MNPLAAEPVAEKEPSLTELVERAQRQDAEAWRQLVVRLERVVWKTVNIMTPDHHLRQDLFAATWLRLAENLGKIRDPERLPGWLAATATNEARSALRKQSRVILTGSDPNEAPHAASNQTTDRTVDEELLKHEFQLAMRAAFGKLDVLCQQLLTLLIVQDPPMSYAEAELHLGRPHGSLGPTRGRCLEKLKRSPDLARFPEFQI